MKPTPKYEQTVRQVHKANKRTPDLNPEESSKSQYGHRAIIRARIELMFELSESKPDAFISNN